MRCARARWVLALAFALGARAAEAQQTDVESLLRQAIALRAERNDAQALPLFRQAWERSGNALTSAQLGLCEQAMGQWIGAEQHLRSALEDRSDPWIARNRAAIEGALARVLTHVTRLELVGGVDGAAVFVDGEARGTLPLPEPLRVLVGTITLEVRREGYYTLTRRIELSAGWMRETLSMRPSREDSAPPPSIAPPRVAAPPPRDFGAPRTAPTIVTDWRPWGWVSLGLSVASASLSVAAALAREGAAVEFNRDCPAAMALDARCTSLRASEGPWIAASIGGALGAALFAGGFIGSRLAPAPGSPLRAAWCAPVVGGALCGARF